MFRPVSSGTSIDDDLFFPRALAWKTGDGGGDWSEADNGVPTTSFITERY